MSRQPKTGNEQKSVKPQVRAILDRHNWFWWATPMNGYGRTGIADTIAFKNGVMIAIESKFNNAKPSARQVGFLNSIRAEQGLAFVVNEKTLTDLDTFLELFGLSVAAAASNHPVSEEVQKSMARAMMALTDYPASLEEYADGKHGLEEEDHDVSTSIN